MVIVISLCMCVVPLYGFLVGLRLMFATFAGKGKEKGGALSWRACGAMCTWRAGLFDAVIGSTGVLVCFQFVLSRVRLVLLF